MVIKSLNPKSSREDWIIALVDDTPHFQRSKIALTPLFESGLSKVDSLTRVGRRHLLRSLKILVEIAATDYLLDIRRSARRGYKFSTYYSWFLFEAVNNCDALTGEVRSPLLKKYLDK